MSATGNPKIKSVHHTAYRCRDAEQTRWFYEDVLGLELAAALAFDQQSGTDNNRNYMHLFFDMGDGGLLAFFDDPKLATEEKFEKTDGFEVHIAFKVDTKEEMLELQRRMQDAGTTCLGPLDHGFCNSVYAFDPNGLQIEVAWNTPDYEKIMTEEGAGAHDAIKKWTKDTRAEKIKLFGEGALDARGKKSKAA